MSKNTGPKSNGEFYVICNLKMSDVLVTQQEFIPSNAMCATRLQGLKPG